MCKGLPASGKDFWCKQEMENHPGIYKRVNKDDLRSLLDLGKWSKSNEKFILKARDRLIQLALQSGFSVICTDTNLAEKHQIRLQELADEYEAEFEIKDFTDVSLEECIARDQKRPNYVGEKVIRSMYNQFLKPQLLTYNPSPNLPMAILSDIDGTLALFGNKNAYNRDFINDVINDPVRKVINNFHKAGYKVILVSGRTSKALEETKEWLKKNVVLYDEIYMPRPEKDMRKDTIIKQEIWDAYIKDKYFVQFILDDRSSVVQFWRSQGLTCLQVAEGDF